MTTPDPFEAAVTVRFRDLDRHDHVNNAVYANYLEEVRRSFFFDELGFDPDAHSFVVGGIELGFRRPVTLGDDLRVTVEPVELGTSSLTLGHEFRVADDVVATGETVLVSVDRESGGSTPLPEELRVRIGDYGVANDVD